MKLTKEQIIKNAKKYFSTAEKYGFKNEALENILGAEFIGAPASTMEKTYNAFEGGLIDHILRVTKYAVSLNDIIPEDMQVSKESLIKVCLLHQIGKAHLFNGDEPSDWHKKNQGKFYNFTEDIVSMSVGERSAFYCMGAGITLSLEEYQGIINYSKIDDNDKQARWHTETIGKLLKSANDLAIMESKFKYK